MAITVDLRHGLKPAPRNRRCRLRSLPYMDVNLLDFDRPKPAPSPPPTFHRSFSSPCCTANETLCHIPRLEIAAGSGSRVLHALVLEAAISMAAGIRPVPVSGGHVGAYRLSNLRGESFAVLKPIMEDPPMVFRSGAGNGGGAGIREVAAFLLDHGGFSGVPPTAMVKILSPINMPPWKAASIQRFVQHEFDAGDLGPSRFSISSVHRIGILDVRMLNIDRHAGNILVKAASSHGGGGYSGYCGDYCELVPIDHGLCLPEQLDDPYFEWLHWPQSSVPFSENELDYIRSLDPFKDAELLRSELPMLTEDSIRVLILCTIFLKNAAAAGLCLAEVGDMMTREFCCMEEGFSKLESICRQAGVLVGWNEEGASEAAEVFQFNMDIGGSGGSVGSGSGSGSGGGGGPKEGDQSSVEVPPLLQRKPPKVPKKKAMMATTSRGGGSGGGGGGSEEAEAVVPLIKSMSFCCVSRISQDGYVSFRGTTEEEWRLFLAAFEELLPAAFKERRKQQQPRIVTSCSF